jgi:hypothetical protein
MEIGWKNNWGFQMPTNKQITNAGNRMYHCLLSPMGYLLDQDNNLINDNSMLWTNDPSLSLRFLSQEAAIKRLRILKEIIPTIDMKSVVFNYTPAGAWIARND